MLRTGTWTLQVRLDSEYGGLWVRVQSAFFSLYNLCTSFSAVQCPATVLLRSSLNDLLRQSLPYNRYLLRHEVGTDRLLMYATMTGRQGFYDWNYDGTTALLCVSRCLIENKVWNRRNLHMQYASSSEVTTEGVKIEDSNCYSRLLNTIIRESAHLVRDLLESFELSFCFTCKICAPAKTKPKHWLKFT